MQTPFHWNAKWIWLDYITPLGISGDYHTERLVGILDSEKNRWGLFRKIFELPDSYSRETSQAKFYISVDSRYKLFINGTYVGRGIYRCNRDNWYYDLYEVASLLLPGKNIIAIIAQYFGEEQSWYEPFRHGRFTEKSLGKGGVIFELIIDSATEDTSLHILSDKSVRSTVCTAYKQDVRRMNVGLPYIEDFDAQKYPENWETLEFDDSSNQWSQTIELMTNLSQPNLVPCDIPRLSETPMRVKGLVSAGKIQPFFDEDDILASQKGNEEPIDFFIQMAMSNYKEEDSELVSSWDPTTPLSLQITDLPFGIVFDLGKVVSGFVYFNFDTDADDTTLDIAWGEKLDEKRGNKFPLLSTFGNKFGMRYHAKQSANSYQRFHWNGFRFLQLHFSGSPANITLKEVGVVLYLYPVESRGEFRCSDPKLDELYQVCNWTLRNCMHDGFEDCPSREQRQWVGDAYVETMVNYTLFGDTQLVKKLIRQVAQSQRGDGITQMATPGDSEVHGLIIPDYCLYWISILYQYYWYTGDTELVVEIFPSVLKALKWFLMFQNPITGLITDLPYWIFIDWSANDKWGANCAVNAQFYRVLHQVIELATAIGWEITLQGLSEKAEIICSGINQYLWNEARNAYADAVVVDKNGAIEKLSQKVTFHSNALVLLYEIAPEERRGLIYRTVFDQPYEKMFVQNNHPIWNGKTANKLIEQEQVIMAEPFFLHHVNQMFAKYNQHDQIMRYLRDGYLEMLDHGATTIWETWSDGGSLCHAWCTTPAYDLATHCLGVRISKPGATEVTIIPHPMGLNWAEGVVPTIKGNIKIRWEWDEWDNQHSQLALYYDAPPDVIIICQPPTMNDSEPSITEEETKPDGWPKMILFTYFR